MRGAMSGLQSGVVATVVLVLLLIFGVTSGKKTKTSEAQKVLQQAAEAAAAIQDEDAKVRVLKDIAAARAKVEGLEGSSEKAAIQEDSDPAFSIQKKAAAQTEAGDIKGALEWSVRLESPLERSRALLGVAEGLLKVKKQSKTSGLKVDTPSGERAMVEPLSH